MIIFSAVLWIRIRNTGTDLDLDTSSEYGSIQIKKNDKLED